VKVAAEGVNGFRVGHLTNDLRTPAQSDELRDEGMPGRVELSLPESGPPEVALPIVERAILVERGDPIAIRLEGPGPVFFFQERTGKGGWRFKMYKLRTMLQNADELKEKYQMQVYIKKVLKKWFVLNVSKRLTTSWGKTTRGIQGFFARRVLSLPRHQSKNRK